MKLKSQGHRGTEATWRAPPASVRTPRLAGSTPGTQDEGPEVGGERKWRGQEPHPRLPHWGQTPLRSRKGEGSHVGTAGMAPGAGRGGSRVTGPGAVSRAAVRAPRPERAPEPARSAPAGLPGGASPPPGWAPAPAVRAPGRAPGVERQVPGGQASSNPRRYLLYPTGRCSLKGACVPGFPPQPPPRRDGRQFPEGTGRGCGLTWSSSRSPRASRAEDRLSAVACVPMKPASSRQAAVYNARSARGPSPQELGGT